MPDSIDGPLFADMLKAGAAVLREHAGEVNELNVFPIPDGDTGGNMLLTLLGGVKALETPPEHLGEAAHAAANGMLLSARGNSGVILSQFFDGLAEGFRALPAADGVQCAAALRQGVGKAYGAVVDPTEGTMLTVFREATDAVCARNFTDITEFFLHFHREAVRVLQKTPEMLAVLKDAGVIDSGGAGFACITCGFCRALKGEMPRDAGLDDVLPAADDEPDYTRFTEDSVLEFGYCTELLLRLQRAKTDLSAFTVEQITGPLREIGDSVVAFRTGSMVKIHVHTKTPDRVLALCQAFGEFLKVKIENMSLQHNSLITEPPEPAEEKAFGVVAVASGEGVKRAFLERGADTVIPGGANRNPSAEDFLKAFDRVHAKTVFVLPNDANAIPAAKQAASLYRGGEARVLESRTVGDGYAAIGMFDAELGDADEIYAQMAGAMTGVVTACVARSCKDSGGAVPVRAGEYFGFSGKTVLSAAGERSAAAKALVDALDLSACSICVLFIGRAGSAAEAEELAAYIRAKHPDLEVYPADGGQETHDYMLVFE